MGQRLTARSYADLRRYLDHGKALRIEPVDWLTPHEAPDDPSWPAPRGWATDPTLGTLRVAPFHTDTGEPAPHVVRVEGHDTFHLLNRLPAKQAFWCGLLAVESVLPTWFGLAERERLVASHRLAPDVMLRNARRWFRGLYRLTDRLDCVEVVGFALDRLRVGRASGRSSVGGLGSVADALHPWVSFDRSTGERAGLAMMCAGIAAGYAADDTERDTKARLWQRSREAAVAFFTARAVLGAASVWADSALLHAASEPSCEPAAVAHSAAGGVPDPVGFASPAVRAFLHAWWVRCRCRLAFAQAPTAELA